MKSLILTVAAFVLGLVITGAVQADHKKGNGSGPHMNSTYKMSSNKFYAKDKFYCSHYCWSSKYNCYLWWCPEVSCYYYWHSPRGCYVPVNYIATYKPTVQVASPATIAQVVNVQNQNTNGSPASVQNQAEGPATPPAEFAAGKVTPIAAK